MEPSIAVAMCQADADSEGYHLPRVRARDQYYAKLEDERAREEGFT